MKEEPRDYVSTVIAGTVRGIKCGEMKLFYKDCEEEEDQELEPSQDIELEETTSTYLVMHWVALVLRRTSI
jgi:hypothetical protein